MKDKPGKTIKSSARHGIKKSKTPVLKKSRPDLQTAVPRPDDYYRSLFENAQVGIYRSCIDGSAIIDVNRKLCDIFGFTREEMISSPATIRWADQAKRAEMIELIRTEGSVSDFEVPIITKSGEVRTCLVSIQMEKESGVIDGTAVDITGLRRVGEELKLKNKVFDASIAANSIADLGGHITQANKAFLDLWGYPELTDVIGRPLADFINNENEAAVIVNALNESGEWEGDYTAKRKDGSTFIAHGLATVVRGEGEEVVGYQSAVIDITDRKQAEENLRESEKNLCAILDATPFPIALVDTQDDNIEFWSRSALDLFGHTAPTAPEWYLLAYPDPDYRQEVIDRWKPFLEKARMSGGAVNTGEYRVSCRDGSVRICELYAAFLADKLVVTFNDITGRKRTEDELQKEKEALEASNEELMAAEEALRSQMDELAVKQQELSESEKKFRDTIKYLDEGYYRCDVDGLLLEHNLAFNEILGCGIDTDLRGKKLPEFWKNPEDRKEYLGVLMANGFIRNYMIDAKKSDGETLVVLASSHLLKDEAGRVTGIVGTFTDFTDRRRMEESLKEAKDNLEIRVIERTAELERSKKLLEETGRLARVGGWEIDLVTNKLTWTDTVYEIHEIGREFQPTVENGINFYSPESVPVISEAVRLAVGEGRPFDIELQLVTARQNRLWVRAVGEAHRENGEIVKVSGVFQDINARKLADDELAAAYRELEAFSYSVSHDLRAPLRTIDGFSQAVLEDYGGKLDGQGKDYLTRIRAASQQMGRLIDDILKLSQITRSEMKVTTVDLSAIARAVAAGLKVAGPERDVTFKIADAVSVNGDPALMRIVMENVINNAWKFTGKHPRAVIEFGAADIAGERTFFVRDDGAGFDMKYVDKLFGAFQRLHSTTEFEGTGIGLTLAKRIILRHRGRIWAEGEVEKGATIYFTI